MIAMNPIDPRLHRIVAAQPYPLLFATISGAHLYGFPSPDSDFDLRGAHVLPLEKVVGLEVRDETVEQSMIVPPDNPGGRARHSVRAEPKQQSSGAQGTDAPYHSGPLEMDIVSHDVRKFFRMLLKKNGYVLEQLYSPLIIHTTPEHAELKEICRAKLQACSSRGDEAHSSARKSQSLLTSAATGVITRHHSHHYFGFAETQWKLFLKSSPRRVKPLLYVYRVLLTGIHLMRTGEVEANLVTLNEEFRLPYIADLVARKLAGPEDLAFGQLLNDADVAFHQAEYERLRGELQAAHETSCLPEVPSEETKAALNDLLVRVRLAHGCQVQSGHTPFGRRILKP
jgi:predicted nucleotidyltransferase